MKILLIGHACSPRQGSEASFTWNWAWHLSRAHRVWVIAHPHDQEGITRFLADRPRPNLRFEWLGVSRWIDPWAPRTGDKGLRFHYMLWLSKARKKAIELHKQIGFDIAHHVSYGTVSAPPATWKFPMPFVWGPIGGGQLSTSSFRHYFGRAWLKEIARNSRIRLLEHSPSARKAAQSSAVVLATNRETAELLVRMGAKDVRLFLDSGIPENFLSQELISGPTVPILTFLWVGRMQPRKALPLALEALAEADVNARLLVAGDGEMRRSWEECSHRLRLESKVEFLGQVPWNQMPALYQRADAFLFTSLRDSFGMQVLEAMGHGLPVLSLDHHGVGTFVPANAAIKIPVTTPRETVNRMAEGIRWLARNPEARRKLGEAGRAFAMTQTWEKRAEVIMKLYSEVTSKRESPKLGSPVPYGSYAVPKRMATIDATVNLKGKRILDLGCGNGCYTTELARRAESVCGIDIQIQNLKAFRTAIPRIQAAGECLPFANESFDAVTMIEVLEHTRCDSRVLDECFRVLRPGGLLVLFVPNKLYPFESHPCHIGRASIGPNIPLVSWFPESLRKHLCDARIYTRRKLLAMAEQAGFQTHRTGYIFPPLDSLRLPFKATYRKFARCLERTFVAMFGVSIYAVLRKPERSMETIRPLPITPSSNIPSYEAMGVRVHAVQISDVVAYMEHWVRERGRCHSVAATGMHGVVEAQHDPEFKKTLNATDMIVPDGTPLVWLGRRLGYDLPHRVYGPGLMLAFCEETKAQGLRHFFYGGEPGVPKELAESLKRRFPNMQVAGTYSPPFRPLTREEDDEIVAMISRANPDVLWVGLGAPKQERWMHAHRDKLNVPVVVGVGAAFDMLSGRRSQAPRWMREHGFEWLFRLFQEPRRLWRRYLIYGTEFIVLIVLESLGLKKFETGVNNSKPQADAQP